jgi:DHA1 family bicyclomycin/chloramphenicol resistance-like MFS transporter
MSAPLSPAAAQAQPAMSPVLVVVLLGLLLGLQPLATDLYLPALPSIQTAFSTQVSQVQLTLTAFLLAFGCSQLAWGPLSDRFGRRPILLAGMAIYVLAALGSASAETMESLIAWRALQGASLGAGVMCARAMVRDLFAPHLGGELQLVILFLFYLQAYLLDVLFFFLSLIEFHRAGVFLSTPYWCDIIQSRTQED